MKLYTLLSLLMLMLVGCLKLERISTLTTDNAALDSLDVVITGNINNIESTITEVGVCWFTNSTPTIDDAKQSIGGTPTMGAFTTKIKNLTPGVYFFRSYLNDGRITYGHTLPVTILAMSFSIESLNVPIQLGTENIVIKTNSPLQISVDQEWIFIDKTELDSSGTLLLTYEANDYATIRTAHITLTGIEGYEKTITITQGENYRVPMLVTRTAFDLTSNSVSTGGVIVEDGGSTISEVGVCWSTHDNPTIDDFKTTGSISEIYENTITDLTPGTTYYIRAYAINNTGTGYGQVIQVTTFANLSFLDFYYKAI